jgi:hypothetical protein
MAITDDGCSAILQTMVPVPFQEGRQFGFNVSALKSAPFFQPLTAAH